MESALYSFYSRVVPFYRSHNLARSPSMILHNSWIKTVPWSNLYSIWFYRSMLVFRHFDSLRLAKKSKAVRRSFVRFSRWCLLVMSPGMSMTVGEGGVSIFFQDFLSFRQRVGHTFPVARHCWWDQFTYPNAVEWPCSWHGTLSSCCYHPTRTQTAWTFQRRNKQDPTNTSHW